MSLQGGGGGGGGNDPEKQKAQEDRMRQQEEMKHSILSQILDQNARARRKPFAFDLYFVKLTLFFLFYFVVNTLKISKPEKAQLVEGQLLRMAQSGQLPGKLNEEQLIQLLESLNQQMPRSTSSVKFDRRRAALDSDDDEDYGL